MRHQGVLSRSFSSSRPQSIALLARTHAENANYRDNELNTRRAKEALQQFRANVLGRTEAWPSDPTIALATSRRRGNIPEVAARIRSIEYEFETRRREPFCATGLVLEGAEQIDGFFRSVGEDNRRYEEGLERVPDALTRRELVQYAIAGFFFLGVPVLYADLAKNAFFDPVSPDTLRLLHAALVAVPVLVMGAMLLSPLGAYVAETVRKSGSERFGRILDLRRRMPKKARWAYLGRSFRMARPLLDDIFQNGTFTQQGVNAQVRREASFFRGAADVATKVDLLYQRDETRERLVVFFRIESPAAYPIPRTPVGFLSIFPEQNLVPISNAR